MTDQPFSVRATRAERLLSFRVSGFWELATVQAFRAEMEAVSRPLVELGDGLDVLADLRDYPTQSQDVAEELQQCVMDGKRMGMRNGVSLYNSALTRIQFARIAASPDFEFTQSPGDARSMLAAGRSVDHRPAVG